MDESEDTLLLSFLDIVCAALGAAVVLFVLFLDIGTYAPAQAVGGRFIMGDFELHPAKVDYRLEILAPNGNRILLVREDLESSEPGDDLIRKFGDSGVPVVLSYPSSKDDTRVVSVNINEPWPGCWRFHLAYLSPERGATYDTARPIGEVTFKWATHKKENLAASTVLKPTFAGYHSLVESSIPVDQAEASCS
ncbi:MAG: hypothetical protein KAH11_09995 [Rhodospirillales bacterium]|nr:hypothetical protein [Rhodospirillales bacterium]